MLRDRDHSAGVAARRTCRSNAARAPDEDFVVEVDRQAVQLDRRAIGRPQRKRPPADTRTRAGTCWSQSSRHQRVESSAAATNGVVRAAGGGEVAKVAARQLPVGLRTNSATGEVVALTSARVAGLHRRGPRCAVTTDRSDHSRAAPVTNGGVSSREGMDLPPHHRPPLAPSPGHVEHETPLPSNGRHGDDLAMVMTPVPPMR